MSNQTKSSGDLFQSKNGIIEDPVANIDSCDISGRAGAAQNSARTKKSSAAFRTISEVADGLGVQQHVLRFWETKFSQVKPLKRGGGRRYYRPEDVNLLQAIHSLLYVEGYTIKGVQKLLRDVGKKQIVASFGVENSIIDAPLSEVAKPKSEEHNFDSNQREVLKSVLAELKELRGMIKPRNN